MEGTGTLNGFGNSYLFVSHQCQHQEVARRRRPRVLPVHTAKFQQ